LNRLALYFVGPGQVAVREEPLPQPSPDQVLVKTVLSAISAGTELLLYRGDIPVNLPVDESIKALPGSFNFPMKYGYSTVGQVVATGSESNSTWKGRTVFAFHPHESYFFASPGDLMPVSDDIAVEDAVFLPNMETATNLVMDGQPLIGEQVAVFGQGVVGLLTTALLACFPLASLVTLDCHRIRRDASQRLGAHASLDPGATDSVEQARTLLQGTRTLRGADLVYELSGDTGALDQAMAVTTFNGRVVIGSWYGRKTVTVNLGGQFHRSRIGHSTAGIEDLHAD